MGGVTIGLPFGAIAGASLALWLVLRREGQFAVPALLWIGLAALIVLVAIAGVAFG